MGAARPTAHSTTICAIASAPGHALRGVLRLSGPDSFAILTELVGEAQPATRGVSEARIVDDCGGLPVHVLRMPGPRSFTREDVVELHLPGNGFLLQAVLAQCLEAGARLAEPGEFIQRAFHSGRLDLTRVEGVLALLQAQDESQQRAAAALLFGGLGDRMGSIRAHLESLRALCEASLDFDEADTGHVPTAELERLAQAASGELAETLGWETRRDAHGAEPLVVLAGAPNAGKSSLFNRLHQSDLPALVADSPGSTRDVLRGTWDFGLGPVALADTAGREESGASEIGQAMQALALAESDRADVLLWVVDAANSVWPALGESGLLANGLLVWNQIDKAGTAQEPPKSKSAAFPLGWVGVSAQTGAGLDRLAEAVRGGLMDGGSAADWTRSLGLRHKKHLREAADSLARAREGLEVDVPLDLVAEDLREATANLDAITGSTTPEDLLTHIFAQFCLGK